MSQSVKSSAKEPELEAAVVDFLDFLHHTTSTKEPKSAQVFTEPVPGDDAFPDLENSHSSHPRSSPRASSPVEYAHILSPTSTEPLSLDTSHQKSPTAKFKAAKSRTRNVSSSNTSQAEPLTEASLKFSASATSNAEQLYSTQSIHSVGNFAKLQDYPSSDEDNDADENGDEDDDEEIRTPQTLRTQPDAQFLPDSNSPITTALSASDNADHLAQEDTPSAAEETDETAPMDPVSGYKSLLLYSSSSASITCTDSDVIPKCEQGSPVEEDPVTSYAALLVYSSSAATIPSTDGNVTPKGERASPVDEDGYTSLLVYSSSGASIPPTGGDVTPKGDRGSQVDHDEGPLAENDDDEEEDEAGEAADRDLLGLRSYDSISDRLEFSASVSITDRVYDDEGKAFPIAPRQFF